MYDITYHKQTLLPKEDRKKYFGFVDKDGEFIKMHSIADNVEVGKGGVGLYRYASLPMTSDPSEMLHSELFNLKGRYDGDGERMVVWKLTKNGSSVPIATATKSGRIESFRDINSTKKIDMPEGGIPSSYVCDKFMFVHAYWWSKMRKIDFANEYCDMVCGEWSQCSFSASVGGDTIYPRMVLSRGNKITGFLLEMKSEIKGTSYAVMLFEEPIPFKDEDDMSALKIQRVSLDRSYGATFEILDSYGMKFPIRIDRINDQIARTKNKKIYRIDPYYYSYGNK